MILIHIDRIQKCIKIFYSHITYVNFSNIYFSLLYSQNNILFLFLLEIAVATNKVWNDISQHLNYQMSANAIHTFVQLGRHGILERLGVRKEKSVPIIDPITEFENYSKKVVFL